MDLPQILTKNQLVKINVFAKKNTLPYFVFEHFLKMILAIFKKVFLDFFRIVEARAKI
jgi:hypothetical protein